MRAMPKDICRKNALKMDTGFVLVVTVDIFTNWRMRGTVVPVAGIPFMISPEDGSTRAD
jgi:hypothetical protein